MHFDTMRRRFLVLLLIGAAGCGAADTTTPLAAPTARNDATYHDGRLVPGSNGQAGTAPSQAGAGLQCSVPQALWGEAKVGPAGGELDVGPHRLIVPPGALTRDTVISATVPAGNTIEIDFQPHGLRFNKPAGLILNASACSGVPDALYLDEIGGPEHISATFSEWWHVIAAPIDHFSGYAVDM